MTQIYRVVDSALVQRENDVLIFKSPHYSHFLLSIKHDEVLKTAAVLPNKSWTKEKTNLEALLKVFLMVWLSSHKMAQYFKTVKKGLIFPICVCW